MIANCGPADYNYDETVGTLRYASRAKNIKNKPKINEDPKDAMIRQFQDEINRLREQLEAQGGGGGSITLSNGQVVPGNVIVQEVIEEIPGVDPELFKQLQSETEEQVMAILTQKGMAEEGKQRVAAQLREIQERRDKEAREKEELAKKLNAMQDKLLVGGKNLLDEYQQHEQQLRLQAQELEQKQVIEIKNRVGYDV